MYYLGFLCIYMSMFCHHLRNKIPHPHNYHYNNKKNIPTTEKEVGILLSQDVITYERNRHKLSHHKLTLPRPGKPYRRKSLTRVSNHRRSHRSSRHRTRPHNLCKRPQP
jgi:hypothetical protein